MHLAAWAAKMKITMFQTAAKYANFYPACHCIVAGTGVYYCVRGDIETFGIRTECA